MKGYIPLLLYYNTKKSFCNKIIEFRRKSCCAIFIVEEMDFRTFTCPVLTVALFNTKRAVARKQGALMENAISQRAQGHSSEQRTRPFDCAQGDKKRVILSEVA